MSKGKKKKKVIAWRGILPRSSDEFLKKLQEKSPPEITTNDVVENLSIGYIEVEKLDYRNSGYCALLTGIESGEIVLMYEDMLPHGCVIKKDPLDDFENHALLSGIDARLLFAAFKSSGVHIDCRY